MSRDADATASDLNPFDFARVSDPTPEDRKHHELVAWFNELETSELERLHMKLIGEEARRREVERTEAERAASREESTISFCRYKLMSEQQRAEADALGDSELAFTFDRNSRLLVDLAHILRDRGVKAETWVVPRLMYEAVVQMEEDLAAQIDEHDRLYGRRPYAEKGEAMSAAESDELPW